jgi:hypothetical protein
MPDRLVLGTAVAAVLLLSPAVAQAAPVTVQLRVEGPTRTFFEGPVTTDVRTFHFTNDRTPHVCDGTAATGGTSSVPVPVRNGALLTAAEEHGFALEGSFGQFGATFTKVGDEAVGFDAATSRYLVEYLGGQASQLGGCSEQVRAGDDVLYAYATGSEPLLKLTAPAGAVPGAPVALNVTDAAGAPVAGAAVAGATTGADGTAVATFTAGPHVLKAEKAGAIRSNAATVCATTGDDGLCGTTVAPPEPQPAPPSGDGSQDEPVVRTAGRIASVTQGRRFARGKGPRVLEGGVTVGRPGLRDVRLRLTRKDGHRCQRFDGRRERFVRTRRCGPTHGTFFSVGTGPAWSYQLPARLPRGRYVLDLRTVDRAGVVTKRLVRGRTRVVFVVR